MERNNEQVSIKGILIPVDWDDKGNVIKAAILTANEDEYIVEENEKGKKMLRLMQRVVKVGGVVREEAGNKLIKVEKFHQTK
jgi:hypothetical protein